MKPVIIIAIAFVLLIPLGSSNLIQQSYANLDVETIELELKEWRKIESDNSDIIILTISFFNNGKYEAYIVTDYVYFVDSQERTFEPDWYSNLHKKDFPITDEDCPFIYNPTINPGLSAEEIFCYEVPKGIGDSFSLDHYDILREVCQSPNTPDCRINSFQFTLTQLSEPNNSSSKIPDWVKNIFGWYAQDQVSEDELLDAIKYLINEGILIVN